MSAEAQTDALSSASKLTLQVKKTKYKEMARSAGCPVSSDEENEVRAAHRTSRRPLPLSPHAQVTTLLSRAQDKWENSREQVEGLQWTPPTLDWGSLIGQTEAKEDAEKIVNSIRYPDKFIGGASTPDNLLFTGPPGCGKGTLAKIIMSKAGCRVFKVDAECISKPPIFWDAFLNIANEERSIVYIDEIDDVFNNKGSRAKNVQRLWEDGDSFPNVLMLATTNDVSKLPAAMRSRFTNQLIFPPLKPDELREQMKRTLEDNPYDLSDEDWQKVDVAGMDGRWVIGWAKAAARRVAQECLECELRAIILDDFTATRPTSDGASTSGAIKPAVEATISSEDKAMVVEELKTLIKPNEESVVTLRTNKPSLVHALSDEALLLLRADDVAQARNSKVSTVKWLPTFLANLKTCLSGAFPGCEIKLNNTHAKLHGHPQKFTGLYLKGMGYMH